MIKEVLIRAAKEEDVSSMMKLICELADYEKALHEVTVDLNTFSEAGFGENPIWKAFVAELDGEIVGMSLFYERYSTWKGRKLYLEDIVVTEALRGQKIGEQLFNATYQYAKDHNYYCLYWQVLDWNTPAIHFYERLGASFDAEWLNAELLVNK